jgi:hypothetical protein
MSFAHQAIPSKLTVVYVLVAVYHRRLMIGAVAVICSRQQSTSHLTTLFRINKPEVKGCETAKLVI